MNAGAGVNLAADLACPAKDFDSELIAARVGLDVSPLQTEDMIDRRWLTACLWPDDLPAIAELDAVLDKIAERTRSEAAFLQLAACPPAKAAAFVTKNVPADDPEVGLLIYNMGSTVRMSDADYAAYAASIAALLQGWGDRGLWVEVESVRGETYSTTIQLRAHRILGGQLRSLVMAKVDLETAAGQSSEASAAFLGPEIPSTKA